MKNNILPYDSRLKPLAKKLRQNMTHSEVKLWNELKRRQMMGYDFDRQTPILKYIIDFFCKEILLAIEIDGNTHDDEPIAKKDEHKQKKLELLGVKFIRFNALDVIHDMPNILQTIENWLLAHEEKSGITGTTINKHNKTKTLPLTTPTTPSSSNP